MKNICLCGHPFKNHWGKVRRQGYGRCFYSGMTSKDLMFIRADDSVKACKCQEFKRDNLKYLEDLYDKRSL